MGHALHAHGGATVTHTAVLATLKQVTRIVQVLIICALFYGVVRFFWWFISNATDLPVIAPVVVDAPVIAPAVEPVKVSHAPLSFNDLYARIKDEVARMGYADRVTGDGFAYFSTDNRSELYIHELGTKLLFTPNISTRWVVCVSAWNGFRKAFEISDFPEVAIRQAITELIRTYAQIIAKESFAKAFVPNCPTCGTQYDTYEYNELDEPCSFGWCPNGECSSHDL